MTPTLSLRTVETTTRPSPAERLWRAQGELFAPAHLPRQLPVFKAGPEDEAPERLH